MKIIGLAGTNGAGKDSLGQILADDYGFLFVTVSDFLRAEAKKRGQEPSREVLRTISAQWRRQKGLGVLVDMAMEKLKKAGKPYKGIVISPMRNTGEAARLKKLGGTLIWVDADPRIRYERIVGRGRDAESKISFDDFIKNEQQEMKASGDDATLNMADIEPMADLTIMNNSPDLAGLKREIKKSLANLLD